MDNHSVFRPSAEFTSMVLALLLITLSVIVDVQGTVDASEINAPQENQNIVFANLHIIQALKDTLDHNTTGALAQLELAKGQLDEASNPIKQ